jgi:hypothetical protein
MNITGQRTRKILILLFTALMLLACDSMFSAIPKSTATPGQAALAPEIIESPNPASSNAQATIDFGQRQLLDLSHQATVVSLNISQAANAAAQSTQDANQRQKLDLDNQQTIIRQNIAQAVATQNYLTQQTKIAKDAAAAVKSRAAEATHSAYLVSVSQTAQVEAIMGAQGAQTAQAAAALTAVPLTATPLAATQAALLMQEYSREQKSFVNQIVNPLIPFIVVLDLLLFILGIILIYRRFILVPWPRQLRFARVNVNPNPLTIIDGGFAEPDPRLEGIIQSESRPADQYGLPVENTAYVEIVNATDPSIANWIAEVEHQLTAEGGIQL